MARPSADEQCHYNIKHNILCFKSSLFDHKKYRCLIYLLSMLS